MNNTGNIKFQYLVLTSKIKNITKHLVKNKQDFRTMNRLKSLIIKRKKCKTMFYVT